MKRILSLFLLLAMTLNLGISCAAPSSSATAAPEPTPAPAALAGTSWACGDASITFAGDGTGIYVNDSGKTFDMTWSQTDTSVSFDYSFYGNRTESFTIQEDGGAMQLVSEKTGNIFTSDGTSGTSSAPESSSYTMQPGEEIDLGFVSFSLTSAQLARGFRSEKGGRLLDASRDSTYWAVTGSIQNTGRESINLSNLFCQMSLDGYTYSGEALAEYNGSLTDTLDPLAKGKLILAAAIPNTLLEQTRDCRLTLAMADGLGRRLSGADSADFAFVIDWPGNQVEDAGASREKVWCAESPALLMPESTTDLRSSGASKTLMNGKLNSCSYSYYPVYDIDDVPSLTEAYYNALKAAGYSVSGSKTSFTVSSGGRRLAQASVDSLGYLSLSIMPGNENYRTRPTAGTPQPEVTEAPMLKMGKTIKTDMLQMSLEKSGTASILYSSIQKTNGIYHYYEPDSGEQFYYIYGKFTNKSSMPLDMRHIYAEFIIDGSHYPGDSIGVRSGASDFVIDLNSGNSCNYYIFASIPRNVLSKAKSIVVKVGFTPDFGSKHISTNNLPLFDRCTDVFEIQAK